MEAVGATLGDLNLKFTITIIYQIGLLLSTEKMMRSQDVIIFSILAMDKDVFNADNSSLMDK